MFLAPIVAFLDTNCNLSLLLADNPEWKREFWMSVFSDDTIDGFYVK